MRRPEKARKKPASPLPFDVSQAASMTECTGILPAQIETGEEGEAISALEGVFPVLPPQDD